MEDNKFLEKIRETKKEIDRNIKRGKLNWIFVKKEWIR
jgi:hypothetical protein